MLGKIKGIEAKILADGTVTNGSHYKSRTSPNQGKLFAQMLTQTEPAPVAAGRKEKSSSRQERNNLFGAATATQSADSARAAGMARALSENGLNSLATTALLKLNALAPQALNSSGLVAGLVQPRGAMSARGLQGPMETGSSVVPKPVAAGRSSSDRGSLAAKFESGETGLGAIGYDETGGTSYGLYQISSRAGTMKAFLGYLEEQAPDLAGRLQSTGSADTGSRSGARPREWQRIADEDPERFEKLQHGFIEETHYLPALREIRERTGVDIGEEPRAVQEVLWSTAVQHGPRGAAKVFSRAIDKMGESADGTDGKQLIDLVYASRAGQFGSSSPAVRSAVQRRFGEEKAMALTMLAQETRAHHALT